jgi:hypothetical protein
MLFYAIAIACKSHAMQYHPEKMGAKDADAPNPCALMHIEKNHGTLIAAAL